MTTKESTSSASSPTAMGPQSINKELEEMTEGPLFTNGVSAYRAHFSCRYVGSVRARSKRKITWRFGLCTNAPDISGRVIREEHQVELTWSINSGKTSLLWNNKDISHFFPSTKSKPPPTVVDFNWQSSSGVGFQIVAHTMPPQNGGQQYELYIAGRSFFSLPSASEFLAMRRSESKDLVSVTPDKTPRKPTMNRDERAVHDEEAFPEVPHDLHQRHDLSSTCTEDDSEDALRSELYSSSLDALRGEMTSAVPELEEMMSRAIVYAYSEDHDSLGSSVANDSYGSFATEDELDPAETEADALFETYEWMKWSAQHEQSDDIYDLKLDFMRGQVESLVAHARHERLSPHAASNIMIGVSAILNFKLARRMQRSTVILTGMRPNITTKDVYRALIPFGSIETVCTAMGDHGFAVCRFSKESSADALCKCAKKDLSALGDRFEIFNLYAKPFAWSKPRDGEPRRVSKASSPRHRRQVIDGGTISSTVTAEHLMCTRQDSEGVELYEMDETVDSDRRPSLRLDDLKKDSLHRRSTRKHVNGKLDSLEFSSSRVSCSPGSLKEMSTGTMSTLSTLDGEEVNNLTGTSIVLK